MNEVTTFIDYSIKNKIYTFYEIYQINIFLIQCTITHNQQYYIFTEF